ncbi:alpha/beta hydrolase family protein [Pseudomonas indica]|uniref:alpha/beta hydrolase family protein n=1 Tax=Pseudomonas indica TaxID=137658 RepID=UPI003FD2B9EB
MPRTARPLSILCLGLLLSYAALHAEEQSPPAEPPAEEAPAEPQATQRSPLPERSQDEAAGLERQLSHKEQQRLKAGDDDFLALWQPANTGTPKGVVILLPGDSESADSPQAIGPLRRKLPDAGWHTLSLTLPDPLDDLPPPRPVGQPAEPTESVEAGEATSKEEAEAPVPEAPTNPAEAGGMQAPEAATAPAKTTPTETPEARRQAHMEKVLARIQSGVDFALEQNASEIVLLGHGTGAYWAAQYLAERKPERIQNLLMVAARVPSGFAPELEDLVPALKLATGDFYYKDQPADRNAAAQRMQAGKRQQHPAYIQIAMKALPGNSAAEQEQLYRRIKGWLMLHVRAKG